MGSDGPHLSWHDGSLPSDEALRAHVLAVLGPGEVAVGRVCPRCGSDRHGQPWARHTAAIPPAGAHPPGKTVPTDREVRDLAAPGTREVHVSLSRAGGHLLTVLSLRGPVGVDVEVVEDVTRWWPGGLVLAAGESATTDLERARCWSAKEAVLKRRGTGLATPMVEVVLADEDGLVDLAAPAGLVAVLAGPV
jgi:4'-phosphopantetheinyl transferase